MQAEESFPGDRCAFLSPAWLETMEAENVATVNKEKYTLLFFPSPSSNGVPATRSCACTRYRYTLYPVNAGLSIKVNVRSLRSFRAILSRKCEMNCSPGSRHQLIPGSYRLSSRSYTGRLWQSACATLYERKVSRYQYGKLDYRD